SALPIAFVESDPTMIGGVTYGRLDYNGRGGEAERLRRRHHTATNSRGRSHRAQVWAGVASEPSLYPGLRAAHGWQGGEARAQARLIDNLWYNFLVAGKFNPISG